MLTDNVELLSNHLSKNSAKMVTFGTLVDAVKIAFSRLTEDDYDQVKSYLIQFLNELHKLRPQEIGVLSLYSVSFPSLIITTARMLARIIGIAEFAVLL